MLKTVELPAGVANLDPGLPNMDGETLSHDADRTWWIVGSEAGARCAADPRLSRGGGGEGSRWRKSRKSRVRPEPAQTEPALANLNFEGLGGFNVRKSRLIEVAFKSKETKGTVID